MYSKSREEILMAAGDTFRAAAIDQLEIWAKRAEVDIIKSILKVPDPSAVVLMLLQQLKQEPLM